MEDKYLEWKAEVNNSFLKTVSAFANFGSGTIEFGISDDGKFLGIEDPDTACLKIENKINDNIKPKPDFVFSINRKKNVITLRVTEGLHKPYLYKGKAYRRTNTSSVEVDMVELKRLTLSGINLTFEDLSYQDQALQFDYLSKVMKENLSVNELSTDVLRTLGFYTKQSEFNNVAAIFADKNSFHGVDIVRFGDSINEIRDRETITNVSVLAQLDLALDFYRKYYQYEEIQGAKREIVELIPEKAFRETIVNALVHRTWDINAHVRVGMHPDRIEVASPGGLTFGVSQEDYLSGSLSVLRNPIIGNMFYRLGFIELFGTGIRRIVDSYAEYKTKPVFRITDNAITVVLPVPTLPLNVNSDEKKVLESLSGEMNLASSEIVQLTGYGKYKVIRLLNKLIDKNLVRVIGTGRGTRYTI